MHLVPPVCQRNGTEAVDSLNLVENEVGRGAKGAGRPLLHLRHTASARDLSVHPGYVGAGVNR
jgi:hypothetical protein